MPINYSVLLCNTLCRSAQSLLETFTCLIWLCEIAKNHQAGSLFRFNELSNGFNHLWELILVYFGPHTKSLRYSASDLHSYLHMRWFQHKDSLYCFFIGYWALKTPSSTITFFISGMIMRRSFLRVRSSGVVSTCSVSICLVVECRVASQVEMF